MDRDVLTLVVQRQSFIDNGIKGFTYHPHGVPLYCVFVMDLVTFVYHPSNRWYGRRDDTPQGVRACHLEKAYRIKLSHLVDAWVSYADLSAMWSDPDTLPEVRRLLAVSP